MSNAWCYIGRTTAPTKQWPEPNTACAAVVDVPEAQPHKAVSKWIKDGLIIERVPVEWARKHLFTPTAYVPESTP